MARYHEVEGSFWEDFQEYGRNMKLLYLYAFTNPSVRDSGLYKISIPTILLNTGLSREEFEEALRGLDGRLHYDCENKVMFVVGKFKRRLSGLINNKNMQKAVLHDLNEFSKSPLSGLFKKKYKGALKGLESLSLPLPLPLPSGEKDKYYNKNLNNNKREKKSVKVGTTAQELINKYKGEG